MATKTPTPTSSAATRKAPAPVAPVRLSVQKTFKLYIGGAFPRTESGRYIQALDAQGGLVANYSRASRKDFRNAVVAARSAQHGWSARSAFNRAQILYRMAEMLESRRQSFAASLVQLAGYTGDEAEAEVSASVDRLVWYAGWADKFVQILGATNPVASPHFNFTIPEPSGVVAVLSSRQSPLLGLVSAVAPVVVSGNTAVVLVENQAPTIAIDFAEVLATSDLPGGVINLLTGLRQEVLGHLGGHKDVDAILCIGPTDEERKALGLEAAETVKRLQFFDDADPATWTTEAMQSPYWILPFVEFKTAWHPMGI